MDKKILSILFSTLIILVLGFVILWGVLNFNKIEDAIDSSSIYTKEDIDKAYSDGYNQALDNKAEYITLIAQYKDSISIMTDSINTLTIQNTEYATTLDTLSAQLESLQSNYDDALENIDTKNNKITELVLEIKSLKETIASNNDTIYELTTSVENLTNDVNYYESYINNTLEDNQVVATFEYDNKIYNIQIVSTGTKLSVVLPEDTDYIKFNGWAVDGEIVDLSTYTITKNTKFVAVIDKSYDVHFMSDSNIIESKIILENSTIANVPSVTKDYYTFLGWSVDGDTIVDMSTYTITRETTFVAIFELTNYKATFVVDDSTYNTQVLTHFDSISIDGPSKEYYTFMGWSVDGELVDISTYSLSADTTFTAVFEETEYTITFMVNDSVYKTIQATHSTILTIESPVLEHFTFKGWSDTSPDSSTINLVDYVVTGDDTIYAVLDAVLYTVNFYDYDNELLDTVQYGSGDMMGIEDPIYHRVVTYNGYSTTLDNRDYEFIGWSIDGVNVIDLSTYNLTSDTNFIAVYRQLLYLVILDFNVAVQEDVVFRHVSYGTIIQINFTPSMFEYDFKGYSVNGTMIDINTYQITQDTTIVAVFEYNSPL